MQVEVERRFSFNFEFSTQQPQGSRMAFKTSSRALIQEQVTKIKGKLYGEAGNVSSERLLSDPLLASGRCLALTRIEHGSTIQ